MCMDKNGNHRWHNGVLYDKNTDMVINLEFLYSSEIPEDIIIGMQKEGLISKTTECPETLI